MKLNNTKEYFLETSMNGKVEIEEHRTPKRLIIGKFTTIRRITVIKAEPTSNVGAMVPIRLIISFICSVNFGSGVWPSLINILEYWSIDDSGCLQPVHQ